MKKNPLFTLLSTLLCTLAVYSGKCAGINDNPNGKAYSYTSAFSVRELGMLHKPLFDTIPESELSKINDQDIASVSVINDLIIVRLKSGDSVIAKKENSVKRLKKNASSGYDEIFTKLEQEATYPGGPRGWLVYLNRTFKYPKEAEINRIQGTVLVQFIVSREGKVRDVEAISGPNLGGLREEAERVIERSGRWNPGMQNGRAVTSYKKQPLTFKLN